MSAVPQIEGLTTEDFLDFAREKPSLMRFLPDEEDLYHIDKKWLCDVLYTQDTDRFQEMVTSAITKRRKKFEESQNQII